MFKICVSDQMHLDRRHIRKQGPKKEYSPREMEHAIEAVINGKMSQSEAARFYGVPQPTISFKIRRLQTLYNASNTKKLIN